jgi:hypothetical protein
MQKKDAAVYASDDEVNETAGEKRLRLAKVYLSELERRHSERLLTGNNENDDATTKKAVSETLKEVGGVRLSVVSARMNTYVFPGVTNAIKSSAPCTGRICVCGRVGDARAQSALSESERPCVEQRRAHSCVRSHRRHNCQMCVSFYRVFTQQAKKFQTTLKRAKWSIKYSG